MHTREYKPDQFFRASIDMMDDFEDCRTYVAEYFSWKVPRYGEAVFSALQDAEEFLFTCMPKRLRICFQPSENQGGSAAQPFPSNRPGCERIILQSRKALKCTRLGRC